MNLIILGPQGSGKGTQAQLIAEKYHLNHISTGALLREEAATQSEKGKLIADIQNKGDLVPFETVLEVLEPAMAKSTSGFILDGTPRDIHQAEYLSWYLDKAKRSIDLVLLLNIPKQESVKRLLNRAKIEHRPDDTPKAIEERLEVYEHQTTPVIKYYQKLGILINIDGTPEIAEIFADICTHLDKIT